MNITTDHTAAILIQNKAVDLTTMQVEGRALLDVCGYKYGKDSKKFIDRQIEKHGLVHGKDYVVETVPNGTYKRCVYKFNFYAANQVLLASMTSEGQQARHEAIELKSSIENKIQGLPINTSDPIMDILEMMIATRKEHLSLSNEIDLLKQEQANGSKALDHQPVNTESITYIRDRINKKYGLPSHVIDHVVYSIHYAPKPAHTIKNNHEKACKAVYTVWHKSEISRLFKRFTDECTKVSKTKAIHPDIDGKFKMIEVNCIAVKDAEKIAAKAIKDIRKALKLKK